MEQTEQVMKDRKGGLQTSRFLVFRFVSRNTVGCNRGLKVILSLIDF